MSQKKDMRLDRRLTSRRNWISPEELQKEIDALPDAAEKGELVDLPGGPKGEDETAEEPPSDTPLQ